MITGKRKYDNEGTGMDEIKCESCFLDANYLMREGKKHIAYCTDCVSNVLLEEALENNRLVDIMALNDDELENYI